MFLFHTITYCLSDDIITILLKIDRLRTEYNCVLSVDDSLLPVYVYY